MLTLKNDFGLADTSHDINLQLPSILTMKNVRKSFKAVT